MFEIENVAELKNANIQINGREILKNVNFSISKGEFCYIVGKTGSGKSTLLKTLYAELPLLSGSGKVAGVILSNIGADQIPSLRKSLGMIFQNFELFEEWTIAENLEFVLKATGWKNKSERKVRIDQVLKSVDLSDHFNTSIHHLSGGEQQRVAIARALLNNPQLIIADEPTGSLDPDTSDEILHRLRDLAIKYNTAVLISTHDYRLIEKFPARVYKCFDGSLVEES